MMSDQIMEKRFCISHRFPEKSGEGFWHDNNEHLTLLCPVSDVCSCKKLQYHISVVNDETKNHHRFVGGTLLLPTIRAKKGSLGSLLFNCGWHGYITDGIFHEEERGYRNLDGILVNHKGE